MASVKQKEENRFKYFISLMFSSYSRIHKYSSDFVAIVIIAGTNRGSSLALFFFF